MASLLNLLYYRTWKFTVDHQSPFIFDTSVLVGLNWPLNKSIKDQFFNLLRVVSAFEAAVQNRPTRWIQADQNKFFTYWADLLQNVPKRTIVPMNQNVITGLRNSYAHCNLYSKKLSWTENAETYDLLKNSLTQSQLQDLNTALQVQTDWVIWNIHQRAVKFCYVISDKDMRDVFNDFQQRCEDTYIKKQQYDPRKIFSSERLLLTKLVWNLNALLIGCYFFQLWFMVIVFVVITFLLCLDFYVYPWWTKLSFLNFVRTITWRQVINVSRDFMFTLYSKLRHKQRSP